MELYGKICSKGKIFGRFFSMRIKIGNKNK